MNDKTRRLLEGLRAGMRGEDVPKYDSKELDIEPHRTYSFSPEREEEIRKKMLELDKKYYVDPAKIEEEAYRGHRLEEAARMKALEEIRDRNSQMQLSDLEEEEDKRIKPQGL